MKLFIYLSVAAFLSFCSDLSAQVHRGESELVSVEQLKPELSRVITYRGFAYPGGDNVKCFVTLSTPKLTFFQSPALRAQLDLVPAQLNKLDKLFRNLAQESIDLAYTPNSDGQLMSAGALLKKIRPMVKAYESEVKEVLVPVQWDLIERYPQYVIINEVGFAKFLLTGAMGEDLKLNDQQKTMLREKTERLHKNLITKMKRIESEVYQELKQCLSPEQLKNVDHLTRGLKATDRVPDLNVLLRHLDLSTGCEGCQANNVDSGESVLVGSSGEGSGKK